jgi:hypothetical protein
MPPSAFPSCGAEWSTLGNLGLTYKDLGDTLRAIAVLGEALVTLEAIESPDAARVRAAIAKLEKEGEV